MVLPARDGPVKIVWPGKPQANLQTGGIAALRQLLDRSSSEQLLLSLNCTRLRRGEPRLYDRICGFVLWYGLARVPGFTPEGFFACAI
jgi:hypothetical protein